MNNSKKIIHIIGTGTIGEPLIGFFARHKKDFDINEITFHKNNPLKEDLTKVKQLLGQGAFLSTDTNKFPGFRDLNIIPSFSTQHAIERASVVIDCTPKGIGLNNKRRYYENYYKEESSNKGFIAQGSEFSFGKIYAHGINDRTLNKDDMFIQVASCNTHNIATLIKTFSNIGAVQNGNFVCIRRANDISQDEKMTAGIKVDAHNNSEFGTHHARDAFELFKTLNNKSIMKLYSSSCKINSQYMHAIHFDVEFYSINGFSEKEYYEFVIKELKENKNISITEKTTSNRIFSFGRDYGHYGRILTHTVVSLPTIQVRKTERDCIYKITGFCFTPQDGNSLMSSINAALWFLYNKNWEKVKEKTNTLKPYLFQEI